MYQYNNNINCMILNDTHQYSSNIKYMIRNNMHACNSNITGMIQNMKQMKEIKINCQYSI